MFEVGAPTRCREALVLGVGFVAERVDDLTAESHFDAVRFDFFALRAYAQFVLSPAQFRLCAYGT